MKIALRSIFFTVLATLIVTAIALAQEIELIDTAGAWRLPFDGTKRITNGPLEGLHTSKSAEAIDYLHPNAVGRVVTAGL